VKKITEPENIFPIGFMCIPRGKVKRVCVVVDYLRTYNDAKELVQFRYVTTHRLCNQTVFNYDVVHTTLQMAEVL
jgi:hypothetical protein